MMALAIKLVADHWRTALVVTLIAGMSLFVGIERARLSVAKSQLNAAQAQLNTEQARTKALGELIATQNAAVLELKRQSDAQAAAGVQAAAASAKALAESNARLAKLAKEAVPTDCKGAVNWAASKAQELSTGWADQ